LQQETDETRQRLNRAADERTERSKAEFISSLLPTLDNLERAIGAAEAGAAILHLNARDPENGKPTSEPEMFMRFLPEIKERTNAVVNITTGGGQGMTLEQRLEAAMRAKPEMCSLNMGSMNFGLFRIAKRIKEFRYDWEADDLESSRDYIFRYTFKDIGYILRETGSFEWVLVFVSVAGLVGALSYTVLLGKIHRIEI
jgi:uncharacterized protein (DUF849 family)